MLAFMLRHPRGRGRKGPQLEEEGPFSQPCHVTAGLMVGGALGVLVQGLAVLLRTGTETRMATQKLPLDCWKGYRPVFPAAGFLDYMGGRALSLSTLLPLTAR